jgi:hypothetical protein
MTIVCLSQEDTIYYMLDKTENIKNFEEREKNDILKNFNKQDNKNVP